VITVRRVKASWSFEATTMLKRLRKILLCFSILLVAAVLIPQMSASSDALKRLDKLIAATPTSEYYFQRSFLLSETGKHALAIEDLQHALERSPGNHKFLMAKAFELNRLGLFAESEKACREADSARRSDLAVEWTQVVLQSCNRHKVRLRR
jgi:tetratricopeptide (TPR) repeat protein